jgi:DNA invertase Pin-like site-specific DNA recombinase
MKRVAIYSRHTGPTTDVPSNLRQAVTNRGDMVVASFVDDGRIVGRGKYAGWNALVATLLEGVDQVAVANVGDLPGRTVNDLLKLLATFRDRGVVLFVSDLRIDTAGASFVVLDLIRAYRAAKLSQAIRAGQARALAAGKRIGRPVIPPGILSRVAACLADGGGIRPTARRFNVSPASVINIRRTISVGQ